MFYLPKEAGSEAVVRLLGLLRKERGQTLAEYSLLVGVLAVGVIITSTFVFRDAIASAFDAVIFCLNTGC